MSTRLLVLGAALAALLVAGCGGGSESDAGAQELLVELGTTGPYPVGVRHLELTDSSREDGPSRGPRFLPTEVWYPADESARGAPGASVIEFVPAALRAPFALLGLRDAVVTGAVQDAAPATAAGPFPLIAFSHGNTGVRFQNFTMAEHLASHGFVVVAPDHLGNAILAERADGSIVSYEAFYGEATLAVRVADIRFLLTEVTQLGAAGSGSFLAGLLDVSRGVGLSGHSFGGATTYAVSAVDERIAAALPLAASYFDETLTPPLAIPAVIAIGTEDKTIGESGNAEDRGVFAASTGPRVLAEFVDGGHFTFSDACALSFGLIGGSDGCGEGTRFATGERFTFISPEQFWPQMNATATALFRWRLVGDPRAGRALRTSPGSPEGGLLYDVAGF